MDHNIDEDGRVVATITMPEELAGRTSLDFDTLFRYQVRKGNPLCCPTFSLKAATGPETRSLAVKKWRAPEAASCPRPSCPATPQLKY